MIVLKKDITKMLCKEITVERMGLMVTAMMCKESIPALTLAKFKVFVDTKKFRNDLIWLHENEYIKWSGYAYAKKASEKNKVNPIAVECIGFMNNLYERKFDPNSTSSTSGLIARLKENSVEDIKLVISNRYEAWKDDNVMNKNLNPTTIFRKKLFEKYLEEAKRTQVGSGILNAVKLDINDGDEITYTNVQKFVDNDLYSFKMYQTDRNGLKTGNGTKQNQYGKDIKKMLKIENNNITNGGNPNFIYIFVKR